MNRSNLNYVVLHNGESYMVFERLGKDVPFEAYNKDKHQGIGNTFDEAIANSSIPRWEIEDKAIEVVFNE